MWVTGVAGFTGRHLITLLNEVTEPLTLVGLDMVPSVVMELDDYHHVDLRQMAAVEALAESTPPDIVFHLAGLMPPKPEADMWQVNAGGTLNLIQALGEQHLSPRVVCIGSAAEYLPTQAGLITEADRCPGYTPYGRVKWGQTSMALALGREYGIDVMVARPFNLIGPGLPNTLVAAQFCEQFARHGDAPIKVGNIESARDFIDIRDAVAAYWQIACHGEAGEIYNVCTGVATKIATLLDHFSELCGGRHRVEVDRARLKSIDANVVYGTFDKLHKLCGWQPRVSLQQSLSDMYQEAVS